MSPRKMQRIQVEAGPVIRTAASQRNGNSPRLKSDRTVRESGNPSRWDKPRTRGWPALLRRKIRRVASDETLIPEKRALPKKKSA